MLCVVELEVSEDNDYVISWDESGDVAFFV